MTAQEKVEAAEAEKAEALKKATEAEAQKAEAIRQAAEAQKAKEKADKQIADLKNLNEDAEKRADAAQLQESKNAKVAKKQKKVTKILSFALIGIMAFIGIVGYFGYNRLKTEHEKQYTAFQIRQTANTQAVKTETEAAKAKAFADAQKAKEDAEAEKVQAKAEAERNRKESEANKALMEDFKKSQEALIAAKAKAEAEAQKVKVESEAKIKAEVENLFPGESRIVVEEYNPRIHKQRQVEKVLGEKKMTAEGELPIFTVSTNPRDVLAKIKGQEKLVKGAYVVLSTDGRPLTVENTPELKNGKNPYRLEVKGSQGFKSVWFAYPN